MKLTSHFLATIFIGIFVEVSREAAIDEGRNQARWPTETEALIDTNCESTDSALDGAHLNLPATCLA